MHSEAEIPNFPMLEFAGKNHIYQGKQSIIWGIMSKRVYQVEFDYYILGELIFCTNNNF